jgi:hypothetical protein
MDESQEHLEFDEAKRLARDAVGFIRRNVGKGIMTYQYNIRYGFMRNLIGGALWGAAGSIGCAVWYLLQNNWQASILFTICSMTFVFLFLLRKRVLHKFAHQYAEILFNEYMAKKGDIK